MKNREDTHIPFHAAFDAALLGLSASDDAKDAELLPEIRRFACQPRQRSSHL